MEKRFSAGTDLALEIAEGLSADRQEGIEVINEEYNDDKITVTTVKIKDKKGEAETGKPMGTYITLESPYIKENEIEKHEEIIKILSEKLGELTDLKETSVILVVGLGNWNVTPDALGPKVITKILVTRHISSEIPEDIDENVRSVAAVAPGVMGITGIETGEIIMGITEKIEPDLIIAIDALAARRASRINSTIQIADTGVCPGSGVGNRRMELSKKTLGIPVIAIGVPTVVDAATLVNDTLDSILDELIEQTSKGTALYQLLANMTGEDKYELISQILNPYEENLFVTPKEVDAVIDRLTNIISNTINIALHPGISKSDINKYI
ncbi:MAG: GPR endopeptidase [Clostridiales bacterium]|nr:GPR endopeptidase [Clostridiales bacterium]